ncbi:MAG: transglutaminaseTgpA domain-containing protein, partial [Anaerolineae bacterium]
MQKLSPRDYLSIFIEDLPALGQMVAGLVTVIWAVTLGNWVSGISVLFVVLFVSLVISYLLTLSEMSDLFALAYSTFFGLVVVWWVAARSLETEETFRSRAMDVLFSVTVWVGDALSGAFTEGDLVFLIVLGLITWFLGFSAMWNLFRARRLWQAVVPPGLALLITVYYYFGPAQLELFLLLYLFLIFVLAVYTNILNREARWAREGIDVMPGTRTHLMRAGVVVVVVLLSFAWLAPTAEANDRLRDMWESEDNPWSAIRDEMDRLFGGVDGAPAVVPDYYGGRTLSMGGPVNLSDNVVMNVYAPLGYRYYWRSKVFDQYNDGTWRTTADVRVSTPFGALRQEQDEPYLGRINIEQRYEILVSSGTDLLFAAPQPCSFIAIAVASEVLLGSEESEHGTTTLVRAQNHVATGESYGVISAMSIADQNALRVAGEGYPLWVAENYLGLPDNITARTYALAQEITTGLDNPYDKAKAIEFYLRSRIIFNESV